MISIYYSSVFAIAVSGTDVYVGGDFDHAGGSIKLANIITFDLRSNLSHE